MAEFLRSFCFDIHRLWALQQSSVVHPDLSSRMLGLHLDSLAELDAVGAIFAGDRFHLWSHAVLGTP
jgi:hypothetical protein